MDDITQVYSEIITKLEVLQAVMEDTGNMKQSIVIQDIIDGIDYIYDYGGVDSDIIDEDNYDKDDE